MKKSFILGIQPEPGGAIFGRVDDPVQIQKAQDFAHDHTIRITKNFLVAGANASQVSGFLATLTGGLKVSIGAGNAVDVNGVHYQLDDAFEVTLDAADPAQARIDLIYATLEEDVAASSELVLFRQLRTLEQLESGTDPFVPTQFTQPTELHSRASIAVRKGVPAGSPAAPVAGAGEAPLWQVHVAANQANLAGGDLTSVRVLINSLYQALARVAALEATLTGGLGGLAEFIQDTVGGFFNSPDSSLTVTYNDGGDVETIAISNAFITEKIQDVLGASFGSPDSSLVVAYDDVGNIETIALAAGYKSLLDGATSSATANTLVKRAVDKGIALDGHSQIGPVLVGPSGSLLDVQLHDNGGTPLVYIYKLNDTGSAAPNAVKILGNCNAMPIDADGVVEIDDWNPTGLTPSGSLLG